MPSRADQLAEKRRVLVLRSQLQRQQLGFSAAAIEAQLGPVDRVLTNATRIVKNPLVIFAAVAGVAFVGPWRLVRWASQGAFFLEIGKKLLRWLTK